MSDCVNDDLVDLFDSSKFNAFGLANSPSILMELARSAAIDMAGAQMFFYSLYEYEIEADGWTFDAAAWQPLSPLSDTLFETEVLIPNETDKSRLLGYDVVVYGDLPEHSPLSCNHIAEEQRVNKYCLFDGLDEAKAAIDGGKFGGGCEEGIYRIVSVSRVEMSEV